MTPDERALRDAWLSELWRPVPEVPRSTREAQRKRDRETSRKVEEMAAEAVHSPSTDLPDLHTSLSTGCAENGLPVVPERFPECA